jgi:hypothetical protein
MIEFDLRVENFDLAALTQADASIAAAVAARGCPFCSGPLHVANYQRKPRGGSLMSQCEDASLRHSLCCGRRGCRRRVLPPSLRFLGRRVYLEAVVVLVCASCSLAVALRPAARACGISARTLKRWRRWWREQASTTPWWKELKSRLRAPLPDETRLPGSLLSHLGQLQSGPRLANLVARCLAPATTWLSDAARFLRGEDSMCEQR